MNAPLYTTEILRLAASLPEPRELERVDGSSEQRSPTCGSTVSLQVQRGEDGRIVAISQQVHACAFGQAGASLLAAGAMGRSRRMRSPVRCWSSKAGFPATRDDPGEWPGLAALVPARSRRSRHGAILLPFKALLAAMKSERG